MARTHKPRSGSLAYTPRKRAKRELPRVHSWQDTGETKPLGFTAYKAGMTHVFALDSQKTSPTSGIEVFLPATVLDAPPLRVFGIRVYSKGYGGSEAETDIWAKEIDADVARKVKLPAKRDPDKKFGELKADEVHDITLIVHTQPRKTSLAKKTPDIMEIAVGGDLEAKLEYAKKILGKEITARDVFNENQFVDVTAVTKGKGYQGRIKRWGIRLQPRKASKGRRRGGTGGSWKPARKLWTEPQPGQMGYHTRTEYNKLILKVGDKAEQVTPAGGFLNYGTVGGDYVLVKGSIPGPAKRVIRLTTPRRAPGEPGFKVVSVNVTSKQGN